MFQTVLPPLWRLFCPWLSVAVLLLGLVGLVGCERQQPTAPAGDSAAAEQAELQRWFPVQPQGAAGLAWGTAVAQIPGLQPVPDRSETYRRVTDPAQLLGVPLQGIEYRFSAAGLEAVLVRFAPDAEGLQQLKRKLFTRYGPVGPYHSTRPEVEGVEGPVKEYLWRFATTELALLLAGPQQESRLLYRVFAAEAG